MRFDADVAKADKGFAKLSDANKNLEKSLKRSAKATKKRTTAMERGFSKAKTQLLAFGAGLLSLRAGLGVLSGIAKKLNEIEATRKDVGDPAIAFALLQPKGKEEENFLRSAIISAGAGVKPSEGLKAFIAEQSVSGSDFETAIPDVLSTFQLGKVISNQELAAETLKISQAFKVTQEEFNSLLVGSARVSGDIEIDFAKAASALLQFKQGTEVDRFTGLSSLAAISASGEFPKTQLREALQGLSRTITQPSDLTESIPGFFELPIDERFQALRSKILSGQGDLTTASIKESGITEDINARALSALFARFEVFEETLRDIPTFTTKFDIEDRLKDIQAVGPIQEKFIAELAGAASELSTLVGPQAERARRELFSKLLTGAEAGGGAAFGVDTPTGEAGFLQRLLRLLVIPQGPGFAPGTALQTTATQAQPVTAVGAEEAIRELISTIGSQIEATRELTQAQGGNAANRKNQNRRTVSAE